MTRTVVIYVFPDVEVLDFTGPIEVFNTANRVQRRSSPSVPPPFRVCTAARTDQSVTARAGLRILPDYPINACPQPDILLVPGGIVDAETSDPVVIEWVASQAKNTGLTASVGTGAFILAGAGLLTGKSATTHWEDLEDLQRTFPEIQVRKHVRWVDEGSVVTSAGIAAGIDMCLHLVARLCGDTLAEATARQMDVPYRRDNSVTV